MKWLHLVLLVVTVAGLVQQCSMQNGEPDDENEDLIEAIECLKGTIHNLTEAITNLTLALKQLPEKDRPEKEGETVQTTPNTTSETPLPDEDEEDGNEAEPTTAVTTPTSLPPDRHPHGNACPWPSSPSLCHCTGGGWRRVVYYNFTDTSCNCPAGWCQTTPPARGCGRESHDQLTCDSAQFHVDGPYSEICGLVLGYQFGSTEAFLASHVNRSITINDAYVTGVSITYGNPRQHVWTYAAGRYERATRTPHYFFCPCEHVSDTFIPSFVGACWSCESGNNSPYGTTGYTLFHDDVLWDGDGCLYTGRCCQFDGPLCFNQALPELATGPLEVRICNYHTSQYSNVIISHLELYVR